MDAKYPFTSTVIGQGILATQVQNTPPLLSALLLTKHTARELKKIDIQTSTKQIQGFTWL